MGNEASLWASLHEICADLNDHSWVFITELQRTAQRVMETLYENGLHINQGKYSACTHTRKLSLSVRLWTVSGLNCCCVPGRAGTADLEHGLCHTPLAKEGRCDPARGGGGRTGTFKTDEGRRQKFCEITSMSLIVICRFHYWGGNTSDFQGKIQWPTFPRKQAGLSAPGPKHSNSNTCWYE